MIETYDEELVHQVHEYLDYLNLAELELVIQLLLRSKGYREVRVVGCQSWHGRSNFGGVDMVARTKNDFEQSLALIQVKQRRPVQRRFIDELRGVMLARGANQGMIFTTGEFAEKAIEEAELYPGRPIELVNGRKLARLLIEQGIGVRPKPLEPKQYPKLILDTVFFDVISEQA